MLLLLQFGKFIQIVPGLIKQGYLEPQVLVVVIEIPIVNDLPARVGHFLEVFSPQFWEESQHDSNLPRDDFQPEFGSQSSSIAVFQEVDFEGGFQSVSSIKGHCPEKGVVGVYVLASIKEQLAKLLGPYLGLFWELGLANQLFPGNHY